MRSVIIAAVAACLVLPVQAATITIKTIDSGSLVMVTGEFDYGDEVAFKDRTVQLSNAVVVLRSRGGNAVAGIGIGRAIRAKRFATLVVDACSSACAIAWLGGTRRLMAPNAQIGFHEVFYVDTHLASGSGNARLGAYLNEIGLSERAVQWIAEKGPDDVNVLTKQVADAIGIDVEIYHDAVPTAVNVPPAQPPAQPFYAPGAPSYTAALALGAANGTVTVFAWLNASDRPSARIAALNGCRNSDWGSVESRNACQIVTEFHAMCVSVASNGHAYGWSTEATQQAADEAALDRCQSYAQQCTIRYWGCDNVAPASRQSSYHSEIYTSAAPSPAPSSAPATYPVPAAPRGSWPGDPAPVVPGGGVTVRPKDNAAGDDSWVDDPYGDGMPQGAPMAPLLYPPAVVYPGPVYRPGPWRGPMVMPRVAAPRRRY